MSSAPFSLPSDLASAQAALLTEREARLRSEAERDAAVADAANAKARLSSTEALIAYLHCRSESSSARSMAHAVSAPNG